MTPSGRFTVSPDAQHAWHYLAIAAGSGITLVMSILRSVLAREPGSTFTLVYGNRRVTSIIFREQLDDLKNRYLQRLQVLHLLSRERQDVDLLNGRVTAGKVRELAATVIDLDSVDQVFLCGPEPMTMEVRDALLDLGCRRRGPQARDNARAVEPGNPPANRRGWHLPQPGRRGPVGRGAVKERVTRGEVPAGSRSASRCCAASADDRSTRHPCRFCVSAGQTCNAHLCPRQRHALAGLRCGPAVRIGYARVSRTPDMVG